MGIGGDESGEEGEKVGVDVESDEVDVVHVDVDGVAIVHVDMDDVVRVDVIGRKMVAMDSIEDRDGDGVFCFGRLAVVKDR